MAGLVPAIHALATLSAIETVLRATIPLGIVVFVVFNLLFDR
jgi:hypothetical protein